LSLASLVDASEDMLAFTPEISRTLSALSASKLDCNKVLALVRLVISVAMESFTPEISRTLAALSASILVWRTVSALVLFVVSVARSNLIWSVSAVRAPLIFVILELLVAISVSNTSISPACDNVVVSNVPILEALLVVRSTRIVIFSSASRVQFLKLLLHLLRS